MFHLQSKNLYRSHARRADGTVKGLVKPCTLAQLPEFGRILPTKMAQLVEQGLFEPHDGSYRITAKGRSVLNQLELTDGVGG